MQGHEPVCLFTLINNECQGNEAAEVYYLFRVPPGQPVNGPLGCKAEQRGRRIRVLGRTDQVEPDEFPGVFETERLKNFYQDNPPVQAFY